MRKKAEKLEQFYPNIIGCRVVVSGIHHHHHKGNLYSVHIYLTVPEKEIVVSHEKHDQHAHEDVYVVIRDAFNAVRRQLEDYSRVRRGDTKTHVPPLYGKVVQLDEREGYGFIETTDGRQVYFHKNSVLEGGFATLSPGCDVRFEEREGEGEEGPQASTVHIIGKHHIVSR